MADQHTIEDWLRGVTYRPGWSFRSGGLADGSQYVIVLATGPDVCDPGKRFVAGPLFRVPEDIPTRTQFLDWLVDSCIPGVEEHERWEWFRIDGRRHRNPHAPGMPAFAVDFSDVDT